METVAPHLRLATRAIIANVWLLEDSMNRKFLVDTGYLLERPMLRLSLWRAGVQRPGDLTAILLTHRHADHASNAQWLREIYDCPVICHAADAPFLSGKTTAAPMVPGATAPHDKFFCQFEDHFPPRVKVDDVYKEGRWKWNFKVLPVPGHTEGSVMLFHKPTKTLFSGDALLTGIPPIRSFEWLQLAMPSYSIDFETCRQHVREHLQAIPEPQFVCAGHGPPVTENIRKKLKSLGKC